MTKREDHCGNCGYLVEYHDVAKSCPGLKTKVWRDRDPIDGALWPEILARDVAARMRAMDEEKRPHMPVLAEPPKVAARVPYGPHEFAGSQGRQAVGLGRRAALARMSVAPFYWKSAAGVEGCAVKGWSPTLAFVATWKRSPGESWGVDTAYAWFPGTTSGPVKVGVAKLLTLLP